MLSKSFKGSKLKASNFKWIFKRDFQTVRNAEPKPVSEEFQFKSFPFPKEDRISKESRIASILQEVKATHGLPFSPSHIEHLVGRATKGRIYQKQGLFAEENGQSKLCSEVNTLNFPLGLGKNQEKYEVSGIDIAEKTQLILQSPHPVRYVIEREILSSQQGFHSSLPSYHTWIMLFGRSLMNSSRHLQTFDKHYDQLVNNIANASDSGMFSADIHHTIIDIPDEHPSFKNGSGHFHMGNKYAVLVGDYFAIRCIYYAERTKTNSVMVSITEGVEDFTTCTFGTNLFDDSVGYPFTLSPTAGLTDWLKYNTKAFGYLKGGLDAALSLHRNMQNPYCQSVMDKFTGKFSAFLKASLELDSLQRSGDSLVPSPFLLTSLPAILFQSQKPEVFEELRRSGYDMDANHVTQLHNIIRDDSISMEQTRNVVHGLAKETKQALVEIAKDEFYINVFESLVDAVAEAV